MWLAVDNQEVGIDRACAWPARYARAGPAESEFGGKVVAELGVHIEHDAWAQQRDSASARKAQTDHGFTGSGCTAGLR